MQVAFDVFLGERPIYDPRIPSNGIAKEAVNCTFRAKALYPTPAPRGLDFNVTQGSKRLFYDPRFNRFMGGSINAGTVSDVFNDSNLLYFVDSGVRYALATNGDRLPFEPSPPVPLSNQPRMRLSRQAAPSALSHEERLGQFRTELGFVAGEPIDVVDTADLFKVLEEAAEESLSAGWYPVEVVAEIFRRVLSRAVIRYGSSALLYNIERLLSPTADKYAYHKGPQYVSTPSTFNAIAHRNNNGGFFYGQRNGVNRATTDDVARVHHLNPADVWYDVDLHVPPFNSFNYNLITTNTLAEATGWYVTYLLAQGTNAYITPATADINPLYTKPYGDVSAGLLPIEAQAINYGGITGPVFPAAFVFKAAEAIDRFFRMRHYEAIIAGGTTSANVYDAHLINWVYSIADSFFYRSPTWHVDGRVGQLAPYNTTTDTLVEFSESWTRPIPMAYAYTWVDRYGRQSAPSYPLIDTGLSVYGQQPQDLITITETPPSWAHTVHLYRAVGDITAMADKVAGAEFMLCNVFPTTVSLTNITIPPANKDFVYNLDTHHHVPMMEDAKLYRMTESGYALWVQNNDSEICISFRHVPYATHYNRTIQLPPGNKILGLETANSILYVITERDHYLLHLGEDNGVDGIRVDIRMLETAPTGCLHPASICNLGWGVAYFSSLGLVMIQGTEVLVPTSTMLDTHQLMNYCPTRCSVYWDSRYIGFKETGGIMIELLDPRFAEGREPSIVRLSYTMDALLASNDGKLYGLPVGSNQIHALFDNADVLPYTYRTFEVESPHLQTWTCFYLTGEGAPVTTTIFVDGRILLEREVPLNKLIRLPRHRPAYKVEIKLQGTAKVVNAIISTTGVQNVPKG